MSDKGILTTGSGTRHMGFALFGRGFTYHGVVATKGDTPGERLRVGRGAALRSIRGFRPKRSTR